MGAFYVGCLVVNPVHRKRTARVAKLLVDTGSEHTWISARVLDKMTIPPEKRDVPFQMANGQTVTRNVGFAIIRLGKRFTIDEVVFAHRGDLQLLGARNLAQR